MNGNLIPAVSAVMKVGSEFFVVKRQNYLKAFPGYQSFPGGKIEKEDKPLENTYGLDQIFWGALKREIFEECGVDLALEEKNIMGARLLASAVTPDFNPIRFVTHFILVEFKFKPLIKLDVGEATEGVWYKVNDFLQRYDRAEMLVVPPLITLFKELAKKDFESLSFPLDIDLKYDTAHEVPMIESVGGVKQFLPLSNTFPPAKRTNSFLIHDVLIDPSPKDEEEYRRFKNSVKKFDVKKIFLTHHHPDHHEFAPRIARELKVSIGMSKDTCERIHSLWGKDYFKDIEIQIFKEGDTLTLTSNGKVKILEVPGHDEGQLAPYLENLNWMIVSDLYQTVGTVVIGGPEGDMKKYLSSLQRVINLSPLYIFPSHGIATGGVHRLEETLEHRHKRGEQIKELLLQGKSEEEMLAIIYKDVDPKLYPYARKTIEAHLKALVK
jgi:endoribonuclease LACTB2